MIAFFQGAIKRLTSRPREAVLLLIVLAVVAFAGIATFRFFIAEAVFSGTPDDCRTASGACWIFLAKWFDPIIYGFVPPDSRWTLLLAVCGLAIALTLLANRMQPKLAVAILLAGGFPFFLAILFPSLPWLPAIQLSQLGGMFLTVIITWIAIVIGLPVGLALALMRTSSMPFLRVVATVYIEIGRGIPTIVALFFGIAVFPLLVPIGFELERLLRVVVVFVFLSSALFAEALRGGLRAVPGEQSEAAWTLGLTSLQSLRLIILPQVLTVALPNIVNICVALLKETSLVLVVGLYDLFGVIQSATVDPVWASQSTKLTGYAFAAAAFWLVCFSLSRLAEQLEHRLRGAPSRN